MRRVGLWFRRPSLRPDEAIVWRKAANRQQGQSRGVGGRLYLTEARLLFEPNQLEHRMRGVDWAVTLDQIDHVGKEARDFNPFTGLRTRLRVDLADGGVELFVVNNLEGVLQVLGSAIPLAPS